MAKVIVGMTTSLDGFVNDRNGSVERLYPDLEALRKTEFLRDAIANTGAVVMGRRAYDMANVTEGTNAAVQKAKKAAGTRDVTVVGGASTAQQCINAGLADELEVGIVPVLFGEGLRLFENLRDEPLQLETIRVMRSPGRTDIKYRVIT